jgi:hypothetical protein
MYSASTSALTIALAGADREDDLEVVPGIAAAGHRVAAVLQQNELGIALHQRQAEEEEHREGEQPEGHGCRERESAGDDARGVQQRERHEVRGSRPA